MRKPATRTRQVVGDARPCSGCAGGKIMPRGAAAAGGQIDCPTCKGKGWVAHSGGLA